VVSSPLLASSVLAALPLDPLGPPLLVTRRRVLDLSDPVSTPARAVRGREGRRYSILQNET
jgi:hypothetical protein